MSFLNERINTEIDEILKEEFQDRLSIVTHKIKFIDKVPVLCLNLANEIQPLLNHLIEVAGGQLVPTPQEAKAVIYFEAHHDLAQLIGKVAGLVDSNWPSASFKRIYLMASNLSANHTAALLDGVEDIAEMLHPGSFVFGNEGKNWINFEA